MYLRDVVEELRYSQDLDNFRRRYPHMDEVQALLVWELSNNPTLGNSLYFAPDFRLYETSRYEAMPVFYILYTFDENRVYLHSIEPKPEA